MIYFLYLDLRQYVLFTFFNIITHLFSEGWNITVEIVNTIGVLLPKKKCLIIEFVKPK